MNKARIAVVMNYFAFRDDLVHQLGHEGFEVIIANEVAQALNKIRKYSVNGIITQLNLPQFDGLELILNLRDLGIDIPIIVISFEDSEMEREVLKAGATAFFNYPVEVATIIDLLRPKGIKR